MMEALRTEVIKNMRSCMISNKERLSVKQLYSDYRTIIGEIVPYQKLGFRTLEDLIQSAPHEFFLTKSGNEFYVKARESEKSAHITEMVSKQKDARRKPSRVRFSRTAHPPRLMSKWRPKSNVPNQYQGSKRPQEVSHAQFVHRGTTGTYKAPSVASKVVIPQHSTYNAPQEKKADMNQRLTINRVKENMKALSMNGSLNGTTSDMGTTNISKPLRKLSNPIPEKPVQPEQTVIKDKSLNPLVSTKKRLNRMISELSLERDSGNSSPTDLPPSDILLPPSPCDILPPPSPCELLPTPSPCELLPLPSPKTPDFVRTGDPLKDLKNFAQLHKLGEVKVNIRQIHPKKKKFYSCLIKVGSSNSYSSYPEEFLNPLEAEICACEKAFEDLIPRFSKKSLMISNATDMLDRIPPMLEKHTHGIWASQLKLDYTDKYGEVLLDDWLQIIDHSPSVQIEKMSGNYILYHCRPGDALQKGQRRPMDVPVSMVSVPSNTIQSGEDNKLNAQVTCAMSASEIWCQQTGTEESERYLNMMDRLQIYYQEHEFQLIPTNISMASYYVAKYDGEYFRVRAVKVTDLQVECFFIDCGDELSIPRSDIFELKREYASAQAQAFVCRLYGLEGLYEVSNNSQSLASLCYKLVVIELAVDDTDNENTNDALAVYMYDCETGQSINEDLISKLTIELASPNLHPDGITEVYVSNIESNGNIYVQVRTKGYENWLKLKEQIEIEMNTKPPKDILYRVVQSNSREKLYLMKQVLDGWNRIKIIDWSPQGDHAQIYFVDDGRSEVISPALENLYPLETFNDIFNNYPYQAVRVRMSLDKIPPNFVELATKLIPEEHPILLKIEGTSEDDLRLVKLFRRDPNDCLFCINASIALDAVIKKEENNNLKGKFNITQDRVPSTGTLKCPPLPEIGGEPKHFEVHVSVAISPYNFFVQPLKSKKELNKMMEKLQKRYENVHYGNLTAEDILPGTIYASKHDDGFWYRTSAIKVIHSGSVSVFYCDFGYYQTLFVKQLIPLDREFMELPYQALNAKLADILPTQSKWTMADCEQFKELVEKKVLFAELINIEKDRLNTCDLVLKLKLIDTNTDDDIFIGDHLVSCGIAVKENRPEV